MREVVISFDTREMWLDVNAFWPPERRELFLLKQDVTKPLSVDTTVWCSVFEIERGIEQYRATEGLPLRIWEGIPRSPEYQTEFWDGIFSVSYRLRHSRDAGFSDWFYLHDMKQALADGWGVTWKPCWIIAITELMGDADAEPFPAEPAGIEPDWTLLGYDILGGGTGFLTNAGYRDDEIDQLKQVLTPYLNPYHLFPRRELAETHFDTIYQREPTHGGFTINGIYLIESVNVANQGMARHAPTVDD